MFCQFHFFSVFHNKGVQLVTSYQKDYVHYQIKNIGSRTHMAYPSL